MKKMGLVLGGGGGKGSYEIGVWMALRDLDLEPEIGGVSGTSVGALNTALYAQGDLHSAVNLWTSLSTEDIVHLDMQKVMTGFLAVLTAAAAPQKIHSIARYFKPNMVFKSGVLSQSYVKQMISQHVNLLRLWSSPLELFACCCQLPLFKPEYFSLKELNIERLTSILLASSAIPLAFDAVHLNGHPYYDGGLRDNVPIRPLYESGYRKMIVVDLDPDGKIDEDQFPDTDFYLITPRQRELFQSGLTQVLSFSPQVNGQRIYSGYRDAVRVLANIPFIHRINLYQKRENFIPAQMDQILRLENGLHVTVHRAEIRILRNQRYAFFDISTQMAGNADLPDSCLMLATELLLAFPDGRRSYVDLNLEAGIQQMYDFPLCLVRNQVFRGYMAFPLPDDIRDFSLIIKDYYDYSPKGPNYFMDFSSAS